MAKQISPDKTTERKSAVKRMLKALNVKVAVEMQTEAPRYNLKNLVASIATVHAQVRTVRIKKVCESKRVGVFLYCSFLLFCTTPPVRFDYTKGPAAIFFGSFTSQNVGYM